MTREIFEKYFKEWIGDLKAHKGGTIKVANVEVDVQSYWDKYEEMYPDTKPEALERELVQRGINIIFPLESIKNNAFGLVDLVESYGVTPVMYLSSLLLQNVALLDEMQKTENINKLNSKWVQNILRTAIIIGAEITIYANKKEIIKYEEKKSIVEEIKAETNKPTIL